MQNTDQTIPIRTEKEECSQTRLLTVEFFSVISLVSLLYFKEIMKEGAASSDFDSLYDNNSCMLSVVESMEEGGSQVRGDIDDEEFVMERRDSNAVVVLRCTFFFLLSSIAIGASILTYYVFSLQQRHRFETQFHDFGAKIVTSLYHATSNKIWAANIMSSVLTSYF
jgi:hypothetical protein